MSDQIEVENVNTPGKTTRVNAAKYTAMRAALMAILPETPPGLTAKEAKAALQDGLPQALFPEGATSGWWAKTVQLDLEAKGLVARSDTKPLRFYKVTA